VSQMNTKRVLKDAGWVDLKGLPKGPNGRALCRYCQKEVPIGRRSFCSEDCVHEWKVRSQPPYARECVAARDHGVCAVCGLDTERLVRENKAAYQEFRENYWRDNRFGQWYEFNQASRFWLEQVSGRKGWPKGTTLHSALWHMDHIQPVVEGGGSCGLDNLRTLCLPCHLDVTRELRGRLAQAKQSNRPGKGTEQAGKPSQSNQMSLW
jgi:5-methylcytosine-specific restriction protein A